MAQGATRPWSTYLFSAEKMPESPIPSKSIISIHTPISVGEGRSSPSPQPSPIEGRGVSTLIPTRSLDGRGGKVQGNRVINW